MSMLTLLFLPVVFVIVGYGLLPYLMRQRVTSAYELLEVRLGLSVRMLGVGMFLALRLVWMSLLVYVTAEALVVMIAPDEIAEIGLEAAKDKWIPWIVLGTGLVAVTYASLGGLRAVVITDLMQTVLLFGGAVLVLAMVSYDFGGLSWFPTKWNKNWDTQPLISFDPSTRVTLLGSILTMMVWQVCTAGGDQVSIQRFMATSDARAARRSFGTQMTVSAVVTLTLCLVGFALLAYYQRHTAALGGLDLKHDADELFPQFIAHQLPMGISGLVVAAMFAAAMSSIDSGVNSITAVVQTDFLDRFSRREWSDRSRVLIARLLAFGIGVTIVVGSMFVGDIPGNITEQTNKTVNLLVPMIFSLFFFAFFVRFANPGGVWIGWLCGFTTAILIGFSGELFGWLESPDHPGIKLAPVSFQWMGPTALLVNLLTGTCACWVLRKGR